MFYPSYHIQSLLFLPTLCVICLLYSCQSNENQKSTAQSDQDPIIADYVSPDRKIGFLDTNGNMVIEPLFDETRNFAGSRAAVNQKGLWGYIDPFGKWVVEPKYIGAWTYSEGLGRIQSAKDRLFGFIDMNGKEYIPPMYADASDFSFGYARVKQGNYYGLINLDNIFVLQPEFEGIRVLSNTWIAIKKDGQWFIRNIKENQDDLGPYLAIYEEHENLFRVKLSIDQKNIIDSEGIFLFNDDILDAYFVYGQSAFIIQNDEGWFLYRRDNKKISPVNYGQIRAVGDNLLAAKKNGKWGLINAQGHELTSFTFDQLYQFEDGYAPVMIDRLWGFLDTTGNLASPATYGLAWPFSEGKARVLTRNGIGVINNSFEFIITPGLGEVRDFHQGRAAIKTYNE